VSDVQDLALTNGQNLLYPTAKEGVVSVPAGSYDLSYISLNLKGKDNENYSCSFRQAPKQKVVVKGNEQTTLDFTGPLELTMSVTNAEAVKQFSLSCKTKTGFPVAGLNRLDKNGSYLGPVKAPQLVILDPDGHEVVKQDFTYG
jgi:hypothetical protein